MSARGGPYVAEAVCHDFTCDGTLSTIYYYGGDNETRGDDRTKVCPPPAVDCYI